MSDSNAAEPNGAVVAVDSIRMQCPRCAAAHTITREAMEAFVAEPPKAGP